MSSMSCPVILVHSGAGTFAKIEQDGITREKADEAIKEAALAGHAALQAGGSAVDAVEAAVVSMENNPCCNAGRGSCLTEEGVVEMDASIMDGSTLHLGGVAALKNFPNPVKVARTVMEKSPHVLFCGEGADKFALEHGYSRVTTDYLVAGHAKIRLEKIPEFKASLSKEFIPESTEETESNPPFKSDSDHDTVGAVCIDGSGNVAYATSTGGVNAKKPGRVGDSPIGGCGGYAENGIGACSTTGIGESIIKACLGKTVCLYLEQGLDVQAACDLGLKQLRDKYGGRGGCIAVDKDGRFGISFITPGMGWAYTKDNILHWGIYPGEDFTQTLEN